MKTVTTNKIFEKKKPPHVHMSAKQQPRNPRYKLPQYSIPRLRKLLDNTSGIAQSHRRYTALRTSVRRRRYLCDNRIKSFGTRCFSATPVPRPDPCGDADPCEDPDFYGSYRGTSTLLVHIMSTFETILRTLVRSNLYIDDYEYFRTAVNPYSAGVCQSETPTLQQQPTLLRILTLLVVTLCAKLVHRDYSGQPALLNRLYKGTPLMYVSTSRRVSTSCCRLSYCQTLHIGQ